MAKKSVEKKNKSKNPPELFSEGKIYKQLSLDNNSQNDAVVFENKTDNVEQQTHVTNNSQKDQQEIQASRIALPSDEEQLEEIEEAVKNQKSKKKKLTSILGLVINLLVVGGILAYQLCTSNSEVAPFSVLVTNINWGYFCLVFLCFGFIMLLESAKFWVLIRKTCKQTRIGLGYTVTALGRYYDCITPLATGGQPFQVLYMNKRGLKGSDSLSVCMGKYVIQQIAFIAFALVIMIFSATMPASGTGATVVTATSWIGFSLNAFVIFLVALISINKKVGDKLVSGTLKLLCKIKILKNYEKHYMKVQKTVSDYQTTMKRYAKDKGTFFSVVILSLLTLFCTYTLPFLIHASFYGFYFELYWKIFTYCVMVDLASSFFPLPGGTGASELSFSVLFASLFGVGGNLFWAMLIWRFFTYYIYILQGLCLMVYDTTRGNKRFEWTKKKWDLEAESRSFEEKELKDFELSLEKKNKVKKENKK